MEQPTTLYLHLGLSKTGSTFLQKSVLPLISSVDIHIKPQGDLVAKRNSWDGLLRAFFMRSPVIWQDLGDDFFAEVLGFIDQRAEDTRHALISDENAASYRDPIWVREHTQSIKKLSMKWGFERCRVLVSVRNQATRLASSYAQVSDRREGASQSDFEEWVVQRTGREQYYRQKGGITLDYNLLFEALAQAVGDGNVLLLPYELMRDNPAKFIYR